MRTKRYCRPVIGGVCSPHEKLQQSAFPADSAGMIADRIRRTTGMQPKMAMRRLTFSMAPNEAYTGDLVTESKRFTCVDTYVCLDLLSCPSILFKSLGRHTSQDSAAFTMLMMATAHTSALLWVRNVDHPAQNEVRPTSREVLMYRRRMYRKPTSSGTSTGSTNGTATHMKMIAPASREGLQSGWI